MICVSKYSIRSRMPSGALCLSSLLLGASSTLLVSGLPPLVLLITVSLLLGICARYYRFALVILFYLLGFSNAVWQFSEHKSRLLPSAHESVDLLVVGTIDSLPTSQQGDIKFRFLVDQFEQTDLLHLAGSYLQLSCYRCPLEFHAGERWQFTVRLKRPHGFASAGAFDYQKYLFRHKIIARGSVRTKQANKLQAVASFGVNKMREKIRDTLAELQSEHLVNKSVGDVKIGHHLIQALAIGDKSHINTAQNKILQKTGISHLMAISGLHIGLVFAVVLALMNLVLRPFTRLYETRARQHLAIVPALSAAVFYAALAGFSISTQRALIMLLIFCVSRFLARPLSLLQVLLSTAVVVVLIDPFSVLDHGFWLSFGAVFVIAVSALEQGQQKERNEKLNLFNLQARLWFGLMPLAVLLFGQVSLISPLVNFILVPLFCLLLIPLTLAGVLLANIGLNVVGEYLLKKLAWSFAWIFEQLEYIAGLKFAVVFTPQVAFWQLVVFVFAALAYLYRWQFKHLILGFCLASLFLSKPMRESDELRISLLDVGQGLAMLITVGDYVMLYDTGPRYRSGFTTADAVVLPYMRHLGITKIDDLIISHADNDHIGGYQTVVDGIPVIRVISSRQDKLPNSHPCRAGMTWKIKATRFEILSPQTATPQGSNNWSCVLMIEHADKKALITGDIEKQVERFMLKTQHDLNADLMLVPHQGSKTSSTQAFIDAVQPSLCLVAAGYKNHYGHPHPQVIQRYKQADIEVLSTIEHGTIEVIIEQKGMHWRSRRTHKPRFWH